MNESTEDTGVFTMCANLLPGKSLLQVHMNTGKTLPKEGSKEFSPTNSWMERKQVQSILNERKELLEEERVEKWGCLAGAVWDHKKKLAEVTRRTGKHFQTLGFEKEGTLYLYPEEALFLLETNSLELTFGGVPVSIQQGYSLLLGSSTGCDLNEYRTFSYLLRQGYKLLRCTNKQACTKYERTIRLDQHAPVKRKHPSQSNDESISSGKIKTDLCSTLEGNLSEERRNTEIGQICKDEPGINLEGNQLNDITIERDEDQETNKNRISKPNVNVVDSEFEKRCAVGNIVSKDCSEIERDRTEISQETQSEIFFDREQNIQHTETIEDKNTDQEDATISSKEKQCNTLMEPHQESKEHCELISTGEIKTICVEGAKSKAYDIAESLLSLGSVIVGKESKQENCTDAGTNLNVTLQSEIIKMLGAHIETDVSKEALSAAASSAASTILSHMTSGGNVDESKKCSNTEIDDQNIAEDGGEIDSETSTAKITNVVETHETQMDTEKESCILRNDVSPKHTSVEENDERNVEILNDKKRPASPHRESNLCEAVPLKKIKTLQNVDILTEHENNIKSVDDSQNSSSVNENYAKGVQDSQNNKHPISPNGANIPCEKDHTKSATVSENPDSEVEIIDVVPEQKSVEFVNLSDESSEDSVKGYVVEDYDSDGIEVIDVGDTSSSETSESNSTSSESDDSVIVEENRHVMWDQERKQILETIPNMYNLSEISIMAPRSDLLPVNVQPQRSQYLISRIGLQSENKERYVSTSQSACQNVQRSIDFDAPSTSSHTYWQPPGPVNDISTVQAIAQIILPMLGLPPNIYPPNQAWMPNNPWFPPRSAWNPESNFNLHPPQRRNWVSSPRGNWTRKPHYTQRPFRGNRGIRGIRGNGRFRDRKQHTRHLSQRVFPFFARRGSNFGYHQNNFSYHRNNFGQIQSELASVSNVNELSGGSNEIEPLPSQLQNESEDRNNLPGCTTKTHKESSDMRPWSRIKSRGKVKKTRGRYFNPPKKYTHMHRLLEDQQEVISLHSDDLSANQSSIKSESDSSIEDFNIENLNEDADSRLKEESENTDESCSSSDTKPLLSPEKCTSFASVFKTLQVIREVDNRTLVSNLHEDIPNPKFDMFSPNKPFKKGSPPTPDFHLCIVGYTDSVPTPQALRALSEALNDSVSILFAIVSPDSISFIQISDVALPCMALNY